MSFEERVKSALAGRAADARARDGGWADLQRRLDEPSSAEPSDLPSIGRRLGAIVLAFAVFALAGAFVWNAFRSGPTSQDSTPSNGYPSPPASGYWILFPDAPEPVGDGPDGAVRVVALTNLPDGTLFLTNTDRGGMCCSAVTGGQMIVQASSSACDKVSGVHSPGTTITITADADIGQHVLGVPVGGQPPRQPDSVLAILGDGFENLTGDQVVEVGGNKGLVASASYAWPEPLCLDAEGSDRSASSDSSRRVEVYETLIRHLADPEGSQPIYVLSDLCAQLMEPEVTCSDRLSREEQEELGMRLRDLGDIVFRAEDDPAFADEPFQEILLGPIVEKPDGLRVEGGSVCGGLCGSGAVYVLVATHDGYQVMGTDDSYGSWIS